MIHQFIVRKIRTRAVELVEQGWCQWAYARDEHGMHVAWHEPSAVRWCASGALLKATEEIAGDDLIEYDEWLCSVIADEIREQGADSGSLPSYNDNPDRTQADVVRLLGGADADTESRTDRPEPPCEAHLVAATAHHAGGID